MSTEQKKEKKIQNLISHNMYFTYICISMQTYKGGKKQLSSLSHILMWKWQLSVEVVGWGCPSSENE